MLVHLHHHAQYSSSDFCMTYTKCFWIGNSCSSPATGSSISTTGWQNTSSDRLIKSKVIRKLSHNTSSLAHTIMHWCALNLVGSDCVPDLTIPAVFAPIEVMHPIHRGLMRDNHKNTPRLQHPASTFVNYATALTLLWEADGIVTLNSNWCVSEQLQSTWRRFWAFVSIHTWRRFWAWSWHIAPIPEHTANLNSMKVADFDPKWTIKNCGTSVISIVAREQWWQASSSQTRQIEIVR